MSSVCINTFGLVAGQIREFEKVFDVLLNSMIEKRLASGKTQINQILKSDLISFMDSITESAHQEVIVYTTSSILISTLMHKYPFINFVKEEIPTMCIPKCSTQFSSILSSLPKVSTPDIMPSKVDVNKKLYLGSELHATSLDVLDKLGVDLVVNCTRNIPNYFDTIDLYSDRIVEYVRVPLNDHGSEDISKYFDSSAKIIQDALDSGKTVLVHCKAGISRSASIVIAYLMRFEKLTFDMAFAKLRLARKCVDPNLGFTAKLIQYEENKKL
jgi:hypothetical protein